MLLLVCIPDNNICLFGLVIINILNIKIKFCRNPVKVKRFIDTQIQFGEMV